VKLKSGTSRAAIESFAGDYKASVIRRYEFPAGMASRFQGELVHLRLDPGMTTPQAVAAMGRDGRAVYAEPNFRIGKTEKLPSDLSEDQWNLRNRLGIDISAVEAWKITTGVRENGPVVAILDTGIDYTHPDLAPNMWINPTQNPNDPMDGRHGTNLIDQDGDPEDDHNHGTHCAGVIGAAANNGGLVGINWNANLMAIKVMDSEGKGDIANAIAALAYANSKGARITNNSWGTEEYSQAVKDVLAASSALHICSAGNNGWDNDTHPSYPASYDLDNVIAVASHNARNQLAPSSNFGANTVHLAAPGVEIPSTLKDGKWGRMSGTSMATPHVAGAAALIASKYPEAGNAELKSRLVHSVDRMASSYADNLISGGRLNAARALVDDRKSPSAPADLSALARDASTVTLQWTAPGDDGEQGTASRYDVRWSTVPIATGEEVKPGEVAFDDALAVKVAAPQTAGSLEAADVPVRPAAQEQTIYCAVRVLDKVGNPSGVSVTSVTVPAATLAFEEPKQGDSRLAPEGSWGFVDVAGRGRVWCDSPQGGYQADRDDSLTSQDISLKGWAEPVLQLDARLNTERKYDACEVEVYGYKWWGGTKWRSVASLSGISDWKTYQVSLEDYVGQDVKVRFRFHSDDSRHFDGVMLDNVVVTGRRSE
ncbi:MAG: S8 family serine peptidase, partial [Candidatus Eremiobacterota bacterium]